MQHLVRVHLGQQLSAEAIAQLRALDKVACRICAGIRAQTTPHCSHCSCATATRPLQLGDSVPDRRRGPDAVQGGVGPAAAQVEQAASTSLPFVDDAVDQRHAMRVVSLSEESKRGGKLL